jgi:hypothetical protein
MARRRRRRQGSRSLGPILLGLTIVVLVVALFYGLGFVLGRVVLGQ